MKRSSLFAVDQLAPTEREESNWASISPILKFRAKAGADRVEARLMASGSRARRQNGLVVVIDATPLLLLCLRVTITSQPAGLITRKSDLRSLKASGSPLCDALQSLSPSPRSNNQANAWLTDRSLSASSPFAAYRVDRSSLPAACQVATS